MLLCCYVIFEFSVDLCECQCECLVVVFLLDVVVCVYWFDWLLIELWCGVLFVNEVIDVLFVMCFVIYDGVVWEECVGLDDDGCLVCEDCLVDVVLVNVVCQFECELGVLFDDGYCFELLLQLVVWLQVIVGMLEVGLMLFVDYGYICCEFYLFECCDGMLMVYYCYCSYVDLLYLFGFNDFIVLVDFSVLVEVGVCVGFVLVSYLLQLVFLIGVGLLQVFEVVYVNVLDEVVCYCFVQQVKWFILFEQMGECFQVMLFVCGFDLLLFFVDFIDGDYVVCL